MAVRGAGRRGASLLGVTVTVPAGQSAPRGRRSRAKGEVAITAASLLVCGLFLLLVWQIVSAAGVFPPFVLATPLQVARAFGVELRNGDLLLNAAVTLREAGLGFLLGAVVAALAGYAIAHIRVLELLVVPFLAAVQGVPIVAVAPIVILLVPGQLTSDVLICASIVVFPLLVTTITALRGVDRDLRDVARVFGASRWQMLLNVELPLAAPVLLAGVKLGLSLAITGAVVAEFVASDAGLGFMVNTAINSFDVATRYVAVLTLAAIGATLYGTVTVLERRVQQWAAE